MDAIVIVNANQAVVLFNPAAEKMFGYPASDVCGHSVTKLMPERFRAGHDAHVRGFHEEGITSRRIDSLGAIYGLRSSGEEFPIEASISHVAVEGEQLTTVILRDITEPKTNKEAQASLVREVDHKAKNAMAVAQALVSLSRGKTIQDYTEAVSGRIACLARAHSLLSQSRWQGAALNDVVEGELGACMYPHRYELRGSPVSLATTAVQPFGLVMHELATNAMKHGAASAKSGVVKVNWSTANRALDLTWSEYGGRATTPPDQLGVGFNLLRRTVINQLDGMLDLEWTPKGLKVKVAIPPNRYSVRNV